MAENSIIATLIQDFIPWAFKVINFKTYNGLSSDLKDEDIEGTFKVTTFQRSRESWWNYDFYPEIPYIVAHYLKLNLTFVEPNWPLNITNINQWINAAINQMKQDKIDYILDPMFRNTQVLKPQLVTLSSGIFDSHLVSIVTTKHRIPKIDFEEAKVFSASIWSCLLASIILSCLVNYLSKWRTQSRESMPSYFAALMSLLVSQPSRVLNRSGRNTSIYGFLILCFVLTVYYKAIVLNKIMHEPKEWCKTIKCVANSGRPIILPVDNIAYTILKNNKDESSIKIIQKAEKAPLLGIKLENMVRVVTGKADFISDSRWNDQLLTSNKFSVITDRFAIIDKANYSMQIRMVRKNHPKSELIRRKINECLEFGIIDKWTERTRDILGFIATSLMVKFYEDDQEMQASFDYMLNYKKENIAMEDYRNTFEYLVVGSIVGCCLFILEMVNTHYKIWPFCIDNTLS